MKRTALTVGRRTAAAAGVLTLGLVGLSPLAHAAEPNYGNITTDAVGSIIVHKHLQGDGTVGKADNQGASEGGQPVAGVEFTAYPINELNLTDPAAWPKITSLASPGAIPDSACANPAAPTLPGYTLGSGTATSSLTNEQGAATIPNLPVKAYLVCETQAPANIVQTAKPFVVTVPHPNESDNRWIYDVHVFPKNVSASLSKTIEDQRSNGYGLGSLITFPVTSTLPSLDADAHYAYFQIRDTMDSRLGEVTVSAVTLSNGTTLTKDQDYTVTTAGQKVSLDFTAQGLIALKGAAGAELKAVFQGKVTSVGDGVIKNTAQLVTDTVYAPTPPNTPTPVPDNPENPIPSNEVVSNWGDIDIRKVDGQDTSASKAGLAGAEFQVYNAADPYATDCSAAVKTGSPLSVGGRTTFISNARGEVDIPGLFVSDSGEDAGRDNRKNATQRCYVVVETKAPAGFTLPADADFEVAVKIGDAANASFDIENTKHAVPSLPLTGAAGKILLTVAGAALLLIAVGSVMVSRYRERKQLAS